MRKKPRKRRRYGRDLEPAASRFEYDRADEKRKIHEEIEESLTEGAQEGFVPDRLDREAELTDQEESEEERESSGQEGADV